ncbi:DNA N-6-adenine-methyltransferase [Mesorhizobium sp.]|uniref:DNA N-6-adenine-methyltransferase n=1 Tax=Mesorhizobium sp. TaxID=1871066 RepID=UPI0012034DFB|nr:DNA N-6-adenine-methyltransferase [Mesorhizobium sp.]TIX28891.1 MAG: adenine methyltransferase [Mesorhizobium sp.]
MSHWEADGKSNDWYTPAYIFAALGCEFDLDVAHPATAKTHVPAKQFISANSLEQDWFGFIWMNPPFGARNSLSTWLDKFFAHGNGIALTPDRTSCPWWQAANRQADAVLFIDKKVKFERPDGSLGKSPSNGTTLFAAGPRAVQALIAADNAGLGSTMCRAQTIIRRQPPEPMGR